MNSHSPRRADLTLERIVPVRIYVAVAVLFLSFALTVGYSYSVTHAVITRHVPLMDAAMEIRLAAAQAHGSQHLLNAGDRTVEENEVVQALEAASWYARAIVEGGVGEEGRFVPIDDSLVLATAWEIMQYIERLKTTIEEESSLEASDASGIAVERDTLFAQVEITARKIEKTIKSLVQREHSLWRTLQLVLILASGAVGTAALLVLRAFGARRRRELAETLRLNGSLGAANQQLEANQQQLRAANQQLAANGQQLRAANQQLAANEQQLRAANQQLAANEQQLLAANQQLTASQQQLRAANEQLAASEARYRSFARNLPGIAFQADLGFSPYFFHGKVAEICGYSEAELVEGRPGWEELVHPDDREGYRRGGEELAVVAGLSLEREYRILPREGGVRWVREVVRNVCDDGGVPRQVQGLIVDISDQRRAEQALSEEQDRARRYLDVANVVMVALDVQGRVTLINRKGAEILECSEAEIVGCDWFSRFLPSRMRDDVRAVFAKIMTGELAPVGYFENPVVGASGRERLMGWYNTMLRDESGAIVGTLSSGEDITDRRSAEEALAREHDLVVRLTDTSPVGVMQIDADGKVVFVNKQVEALLGVSAERLKGWAYSERDWKITEVGGAPVSDEALPLNRIRASLRPECGLRYEIDTWDHRRLTLSVNGAPLIGTDGRFEGAVLSVEDITERLRMEEELQKAQRLESLGFLAGGIAHDFNNLLGGLFGFLDMAREECRGTETAAAEYLEKALKGFHRARDLTQQLLTFAKGGAPVRRATSVASVVRDATALALSGSSVKPSYTIAEDLWDGYVDEGQISQVVNNLVVNARQAMPQGGKLIVSCRNVRAAEIAGAPFERGRFVEVCIKDHGIGIPPEHLAKVFDPFFTTKQHGSGLGLATSYSIVRKHDGHVEVDSELGVGTCFRLYLPAATNEVVEKGPLEGVEGDVAGGRVLLMDDEEVILEMAGELLRKLGFAVELARSGEEALAAWRSARETAAPFDVMILDLTIPGGMGGVKTIEEIRKSDRLVKAIVSSGYSEDPVMADPEAYGFDGVVGKPYRIRDLRQALAKVLA